MKAISRDLGTLFSVGAIGGLSDGQLLGRFLERREAAAFEFIVYRHGPMVWGVCLRVLRHSHDAEDAFQATFLVLARKAASVRPRENLGNWLYGVAYRTAMKARATRTKRSGREGQVLDMPEPMAVPDDQRANLPEWFDRELSRLPEKYRIPVVLCHLEGRTHQEAASQLGVPIGTISSRLSRARAMLAKRLSRPGMTLTVGSMTVLLAQESASASVPTKLIGSTAQAASLFAAGGTATAGVFSAEVAALTGEIMKMMLLSKIKVITAVVLVFSALVVSGIGVAYQAQADEEPQAPEQHPLAAGDFTGVQTLKEALVVVRQKLMRDGKPEYAALISELHVREAMLTGIRSYEAHIDEEEQKNPGTKEYFLVTVKPVFMKIMDEGTWPPNCSFFYFYTLTSTVGDKSVAYDGFWLRVDSGTKKEKFEGFALPIVDLAYGKFGF